MVAGPDSASLLHQPSAAINAALAKAGLGVGDVDLFEINEAFAAVGIASMADLGITDEVTNVNGGAIALGHPIGMSGNRLALTALHELRRRGGGTAAVALCGGGGQGDALIVTSLAYDRLRLTAAFWARIVPFAHLGAYQLRIRNSHAPRSRPRNSEPRPSVRGSLDAPWRGVRPGEAVFEGIARSATVAGQKRFRGSADRGVGMTSVATAHFGSGGGPASRPARRRTTSPTVARAS